MRMERLRTTPKTILSLVLFSTLSILFLSHKQQDILPTALVITQTPPTYFSTIFLLLIFLTSTILLARILITKQFTPEEHTQLQALQQYMLDNEHHANPHTLLQTLLARHPTKKCIIAAAQHYYTTHERKNVHILTNYFYKYLNEGHNEDKLIEQALTQHAQPRHIASALQEAKKRLF